MRHLLDLHTWRNLPRGLEMLLDPCLIDLCLEAQELMRYRLLGFRVWLNADRFLEPYRISPLGVALADCSVVSNGIAKPCRDDIDDPLLLLDPAPIGFNDSCKALFE